MMLVRAIASDRALGIAVNKGNIDATRVLLTAGLA
jgi:hypothetical protein